MEMKKFTFKGKRYLVDTDRLAYVAVMFILIIIVIIGFIKVSAMDYEVFLMKN